MSENALPDRDFRGILLGACRSESDDVGVGWGKDWGKWSKPDWLTSNTRGDACCLRLGFLRMLPTGRCSNRARRFLRGFYEGQQRLRGVCGIASAGKLADNDQHCRARTPPPQRRWVSSHLASHSARCLIRCLSPASANTQSMRSKAESPTHARGSTATSPRWSPPSKTLPAWRSPCSKTRGPGRTASSRAVASERSTSSSETCDAT
jgi:hypothetical protein